MQVHYEVGIQAYRHDGFDLGTITVASLEGVFAHNDYREARQFAKALMAITDEEILTEYTPHEFGHSKGIWIKHIFIDRWKEDKQGVVDPDPKFKAKIFPRKVSDG